MRYQAPKGSLVWAEWARLVECAGEARSHYYAAALRGLDGSAVEAMRLRALALKASAIAEAARRGSL